MWHIRYHLRCIQTINAIWANTIVGVITHLTSAPVCRWRWRKKCKNTCLHLPPHLVAHHPAVPRNLKQKYHPWSQYYITLSVTCISHALNNNMSVSPNIMASSLNSIPMQVYLLSCSLPTSDKCNVFSLNTLLIVVRTLTTSNKST